MMSGPREETIGKINRTLIVTKTDANRSNPILQEGVENLIMRNKAVGMSEELEIFTNKGQYLFDTGGRARNCAIDPFFCQQNCTFNALRLTQLT